MAVFLNEWKLRPRNQGGRDRGGMAVAQREPRNERARDRRRADDDVFSATNLQGPSGFSFLVF